MYGGSGLGLNISRKLCHIHGGEVGVASKLNCGSTFGFFFRVKRSEQPPDYGALTEEPGLDDVQIRELGSAPHEVVSGKGTPKSSNASRAAKAVDKGSRGNFQQDDLSHKPKVCACSQNERELSMA